MEGEKQYKPNGPYLLIGPKEDTCRAGAVGRRGGYQKRERHR